jgi:hypothetical protein
MVHLRVTISLIDEDYPDGVGVELSRTELPKFEITTKTDRVTLEDIEEQTLSIGHEVMRQMLISQWEIADQEQVIAYCAVSQGKYKSMALPLNGSRVA